MFYEEIRRQAEAAPRAALPAVASALWKAFGEGHLSEAEAEALSGLIEARSISASPVAKPRRAVGTRPRTDASMERRRRWAASGRLPPGISARFTLAEQSALAVVTVESLKRGDCRLALDHIAAVAGVSRATVRNAIRQAKVLGLVAVEERRQSRFRNDTNVVSIISKEWLAWMRLARRSDALGGGGKFVRGTNTPVSYPVNSEGRRSRKGCRKATDDLSANASPGILQPDRGGWAMW
ncbi:helix-turn-helix domain-containing protein [Methylobacterium sp. WL116]|uniref:helix-turn-helix domain-containing protein n=1 Tax=Methylobacterium sp. WL116 TaxID=2603889 RepID=UPI0011C97169|nr:helix-turn-helix domain-containing protein [Methylobacterium sp. WL116]TXM92855.1 helix-turn-helix domain-containing protein [Methylobacterium sp. WL116]